MPTSFDYLLTQAVSRIYLDNVPHIQSSWVTQGLKIGQVALGFGADDMGSVMIEENVVSAAGTTHRTSTEELVHLIRRLGKTPVQRDTLYREVRVFCSSGPAANRTVALLLATTAANDEHGNAKPHARGRRLVRDEGDSPSCGSAIPHLRRSDPVSVGLVRRGRVPSAPGHGSPCRRHRRCRCRLLVAGPTGRGAEDAALARRYLRARRPVHAARPGRDQRPDRAHGRAARRRSHRCSPTRRSTAARR